MVCICRGNEDADANFSIFGAQKQKAFSNILSDTAVVMSF